MELPKGQMNGTSIVKPTKVITDVECPVVRTYNKRRDRTVERTKPSDKIQNVKYDKSITLEMIAKQYVLMALEAHGGSICQAARSLGIGKNTVYRYLGKRYGKQYK